MAKQAKKSVKSIDAPQVTSKDSLRALSSVDVPRLSDEDLLEEALLSECDWSGTVVDRVIFERSRLESVIVHSGKLKRMELVDVVMDACDLQGSEFEKAHLNRVVISNSRLAGCIFLDLRAENLRVEDANLDHAMFHRAVLHAARFEHTSLRNASFDRSNLSGVIFRDCDLTNADLHGANLKEADLRGSTIDGLRVDVIDLRGAIVDASQAVALAGLLGVIVRDLEEHE